MNESILELVNIEASYGPVQALRGVTLAVPKGKIVTVLGAYPTLVVAASDVGDRDFDRLVNRADWAAPWVGGASALSLFPLATDRDIVGVLEVDTLQPLAPEQTRLVSSILRVYRNFQGLLDYSERDTLTGLLNRKTFDETFMRSAGEPPPAAAVVTATGGRRHGVEFGTWLGIIDIDHFKGVNDGHGHLIGDEVLLLLSRLMRTSFRFSDKLYRFGGEEFVVLMRCASATDAARALERLRDNVQRYAFPRVGQITVSVGFTEVRATDTPSSAFERADRAVYFAKGNGRNQVANHAELVASGKLAEDARVGDMELF